MTYENVRDGYLDAYDLKMTKGVRTSADWRVRFRRLERLVYAYKEAKPADRKELEDELFAAHESFQEGQALLLNSGPANLDGAKAYADARIRRRLGTAATVICEMWDPESGRWYPGRSGHGKAQGGVPAAIWNRIPEVGHEDKQDWAFGKNCAEVDSLIQAYAGGRTAANLQGCFFFSYHIPLRRYIGPCRTCNQWIPQSSGEAYRLNG